MKHLRIHQFTPATAVGDGVTTGVLFTQKLLRQLGHHSEIYCAHIPQQLNQIHHHSHFQADQCDLLLVHHSMGHPLEDWILSQTCQKALVYHNITPSEFFAPGSAEQHYSEVGRQQLKRWACHFSGAIGDSPYNSQELEEASYPNITTLPMLVELERFAGASAATTSLGHAPQRPLLLSVGRLAENKRQHLLIDALWHLKNMQHTGPTPQLLLVGGTTSQGYANSLHHHIHKLGLENDIILTGKCSDAQLRGLYQHASLYWCASAHEGFCMPLIEAGWFNLPVVSIASSNIPATLGEAGLILNNSNPMELASVSHMVLTDPALQQQLIDAGQRNLQRYSEATLMPQLQDYITRLTDTTTSACAP